MGKWLPANQRLKSCNPLAHIKISVYVADVHGGETLLMERHLLAALRAVAEPTRLRLVVLCARGELTVSELTQILGQRPAAGVPAI